MPIRFKAVTASGNWASPTDFAGAGACIGLPLGAAGGLGCFGGVGGAS